MKPDLEKAPVPNSAATLDRKLCQVGGVNQNYVSAAGTSYHVQIEDLGPVLDRALEIEVRRVNVIIYANYGEPNARIVHGRDYDFPDVRTAEHNRLIEEKIKALAVDARSVIEERERREVSRIKDLLREYYLTKDEAAKRQFETANAQFPFLFSRAWMELKNERGPVPVAAVAVSEPVLAATPVPPPPPAPVTAEVVTAEVEPELELPEDVLYPMDVELRQKVLEIEALIVKLGMDLRELKKRGMADDILMQTCRKLVARAKDSITGREASEFNVRRLEMTANSLTTTWRQIKSRLR
jgi:hypothetical protein